MTLYTGSCHCGAIAFEVKGELARVTSCNCSICTMKGYMHWIVPKSSFRLLTDRRAITSYRFNTGVAQHHFCSVCGVAPFYVPRSDPDKIDVNVRCLQNVDVATLPVDEFDGKNWEQAERVWEARE